MLVCMVWFELEGKNVGFWVGVMLLI